MQSYRYVILGGGVTAGYSAKEFAAGQLGKEELCLVSAEDRLPYDRPPLSKNVLQGEIEPEDATINERGFYDEHGIELKLGELVTDVDFDSRALETEGGERIQYDNLLIATGARVRRLDVPGADLDNILYLRDMDDVRRIIAAADASERAVVLGGGFIGTEVAASLADRGLDVTLISGEDRLLKGRPMAPEMSDFFQGYFRDRGVELILADRAASFEGGGRVSAVTLESGGRVEADLVVAGIGVLPNVELFEDTALDVDDGLVVDESLQTGIANVFAAGDVARYEDVLFGRMRRIEHWDNARSQGAHWARIMLGDKEPFDHIPYFFSDVFDLSWEYWGDQQGAERVVYRGDVQGGRFSAWWLKEGKVVAAFVMDRPGEEREAAQRLIRSSERISADVLEDEARNLEV
jgi:NADPH-dependent 2,4-dienoyl-CoA reductase/sulfur reductase-like enzyme